MGFNWVMVPSRQLDGGHARGGGYSLQERIGHQGWIRWTAPSVPRAPQSRQQIPCSIWDIRILKHVLFIWKSNLAGRPVWDLATLVLKAALLGSGAASAPTAAPHLTWWGSPPAGAFASALLTPLLQSLPDLSGSGGLIWYWSPHPAFLSHLELIVKLQILCP